jgi:chorismate-pyruvate lyase
MSDNDAADFDVQLAAVERFIADVQQGSVPTGEAMRAYRDVHRPAIERLRAQLAEFEALLAEAGVTEA